MKKSHSKRRKAKKRQANLAVTIILSLLVAAACIYMVFGVNPGKTGSVIKLNLVKSYPMADKLASESGIVKVSNVEFYATNDTDKAIGGGILTYKAIVTGIDKDNNKTEVILTNVTVAKSSEYEHIRNNSVALFEKTEPRDVSVDVSFGEFEKTYTYNVFKQDNSVNNPAVLINKYAGVDSDFLPLYITQSDEIVYTNGRSNEVSRMGKEASDHLVSLIKAAAKEGYTITACSGYRSYDTQTVLYNRAVAKLGADQNDTAPPGHSEHQSGLTMDVKFPQRTPYLSVAQADCAMYDWMLEHAHEYGFVLRYPKSAEDLTGYMFEPWHWRYIGVELATEYHNSGMECLDEFLCIPRTASFSY